MATEPAILHLPTTEERETELLKVRKSFNVGSHVLLTTELTEV